MFNDLMSDWLKVLNWQLTDSDDITRTLEVRAWLQGQGFYDLLIHRSNPPYGSELHWSRISDAPLAITELFFRLFTSPQKAEYLGVFATPLILGIVFIFCASMASKKIYDGKINLLICFLLFIFYDAIWVNFVPGRVDHHGLQLITLALTLYGVMDNSKRGGIIAGISLAISLAIGFELLIFQLLIVFWLVMMWSIYGKERATSVISFCIALFLGIIAVFLIDVAPSHYLEQANERLSIAQLAPICTGALLLLAAAYTLSYGSIFIRMLALAIIGGAVITFALQFSMLFAPLYWQVSPRLMQYWFSDIGETFPLIKRRLTAILLLGGFAIMSVIAATVRLIAICKKPNKLNVLNYILPYIMLLAATGMMMFFQTRVISQASFMSIIFATALLAMALEKLPIIAAIPIILIYNPFLPYGLRQIIVTYNLPINAPPKIIPKDAAKIKASNAQLAMLKGGNRCYSKPYYATLASLPNGLIANNISIGSYTLINTDHNVLSIPFHRDKGREYLYDIFLGNNETAYKLLKKRNVNYVAYCSGATEIRRIVEYSPQSFMAQTALDNPPDFLEKITNIGPSDIVIYKVK